MDIIALIIMLEIVQYLFHWLNVDLFPVKLILDNNNQLKEE
jgi:hypothetical protein